MATAGKLKPPQIGHTHHNMKATLTIAFIFLSLALAISQTSKDTSAQYEIVLDGDKVVIDRDTAIAFRIRNLSEKKIISPELVWGLSVVWDGRNYKRDPKYIGSWNGSGEILPKSAMFTCFGLSEYLIPAKALTSGRHTIALKDAFTKSNTLVVFVEEPK